MVASDFREFGAVGGVGSAFCATLLAEECWLEAGAEVFGDGFLGILLHAAVDGGVDLQAVVVDVVFRPVGFGVFLYPTEEGVGLPGY